ncbi:MAG: glycosyltransferase family 2 protein [Chitinophagaceae bacterium]
MPYNFMRASVTVSIFATMSAIAGISVVIPNYNGEILLPQVLPTVFTALHNAGLPFEIIVVDDCSADGSIQLLNERFSGIRVLQNNINAVSGFSVTANKGIRAAKYDWVLLLNSDVKLEPGYFKPLLKYTERTNVFGVMGRIIGWDDDTIQDGAKHSFFQGVKIKTYGNYLLRDVGAMADGIYSMYLSGANAFMNKKIFIEIGGLNELFSPFYVEDFELSLRAWRLGYECFYDYNAVCRHKTSATIVSSNKKKRIKKIYNRNKMYLHAIHLSRGKRLLWLFQLAGECLIHLITLQWSFITAVSLFLGSYKKVVSGRKKLWQMAGEKKLLPVNEVVDKIIASLKGKEVTRF